MKKILITGANSYIGTSFEKYIHENYPDDYIIDTLDMLDKNWREKSFSEYDSVFHVAGIAHQKETSKNAHSYYEVNRDLAVETAKKAKAEGVKQFVFLSSMSVYGMDIGVIKKDTLPNPKSHYGKSKWQAEQEISLLNDDNFLVCILRPPMVYGEGCKGNYQTLVKIAERFPVFPKYKNKRSVIFVDNLSKKVKILIDQKCSGIYFPQNPEYSCTSEIIAEIALKMGKKVVFVRIFNPLIFVLKFVSAKCRKAFGDLIYEDMDVIE